MSGYEKDVGSKTTMRITYPEGAIQKPELYEKSSLFVLSAFKPPDFKWLRHMVFKEKLVRLCQWIISGLGRRADVVYLYYNYLNLSQLMTSSSAKKFDACVIFPNNWYIIIAT